MGLWGGDAVDDSDGDVAKLGHILPNIAAFKGRGDEQLSAQHWHVQGGSVK